MAQIIAEVTAQIPIEKVAILHREGRVGLMEPSVVIAVSAAHRGEAYKASRLIIDRIKHEAPIWKKEILPDGSGVWSEGCKACSPY